MNDITVNGAAITAAAIAEEAQHHPARDWAAAERAAAEALVVRELLLQEAEREGIAPVPFTDTDGRRETDEEAMIRALIRGAVSVPSVDEASLRRFYDNNRRRFRSPDLFEAAHILYPAHPDDAAAIETATARAEAAIALLWSEPGRFADVARSESACSSASNGGNLGQVSLGQTVPEFETFLVNLEPGQLCPVPVRTRYGVHVLRLDRRIDGRQLPFELVRERVAEYLEQAVWHRAVSQFIRILVSRSEITGIELAGADGPLVQ
jgi:peptidyl-prolyl cis-trans isomerase C